MKKQDKLTELKFHTHDRFAEIKTHKPALKRRLLQLAEAYPEQFRLVSDDGKGGLHFHVDRRRVSIRLTAPYSEQRLEKLSRQAIREGIQDRI